MGALVIGIISAIIIDAVVAFIIWLIFDNCFKDIIERAVVVCGVVICLAVLILIPAATVSYDMNLYKSWTKEYEVQKATIESSMKSEKVGGLEKIRLLEEANELNAELVRKQYRCQQWYGFTGDKEILKMEPIEFD